MTTLAGDSAQVASAQGPGAGVLSHDLSLGRDLATRHVEALAAGATSVVGLGAGLLLNMPHGQLLAGLCLWLVCVGRMSMIVRDEPVAGLARLVAGLVVGSAAVAGVVDLDRAVLTDWWTVLAALSLSMLLVTAEVHRRRPARRIIVVGDSRPVQDAIATWTSSGREVLCGAVVVPRERTSVSRVAAVLKLVEETRADTVLCFVEGLDEDEVRSLGWMLEKTRVRIAVSSAAGYAAPSRVHLSRLHGRTVAVLRPSRPDPVVRALKAGFDRLAAMGMLIVLSPLLLVLGVAIRLESKGPAIFRQVRVGHDGRPFTMYKFRSMAMDAEATKHDLAEQDEGNGVLFKIRRDPRVTRLGRALRRMSLDEVPQLLNVVRGEMSLVGPRPALPEEVANYDELARRRLAVRPGLTGLWQVSGRSDLDWDQSLALDLDYTDNVTLGRDLVICLDTVRAVGTGRGAY